MLILFFIPFFGIVQELEEDEYDKLYRNSYSVGLHFNTKGWGLYGELSKQKVYKYHHTLSLQVSNIHHKNEFRSATLTPARTYYYRKINSFLVFRPAVGGILKLFESIRENGIQIQLKWKVGPSFGLLKPVYLEVSKQSGFQTFTISERYDPEVHGFSVIEGKSNWFKGIGESNFELGIHQKTGLNFNFSKEKDGISGGEIGFLVDYFPGREIPIMYGSTNYKLFTSFYIQFELGNRF